MPRGRDLEELKNQLPEEWKDVPVLSFSQISKADDCAFLWYIDYVMKVESRQNTSRMDIGTIGHELLKDLYMYIADNGTTPHTWVEERLPAKLQEVAADQIHFPDQVNALNTAMKIVVRYCEDSLRVLGDHTPVGVEQHFYVLVTLEDSRRFVLQGYIDLLTIDSKDRVWCWDHKFSDGLWKPWRGKMFVQLVIYQILLRIDGLPIYGGILNNLNSHDYKNLDEQPDLKLFNRQLLFRTEGELQNFWTEFLHMAGHLLDIMENKIPARRSIHEYTCSRCHRMVPCHANLLGEPLAEALQVYTEQQVALRSQVVGTGVTIEM